MSKNRDIYSEGLVNQRWWQVNDRIRALYESGQKHTGEQRFHIWAVRPYELQLLPPPA